MDHYWPNFIPLDWSCSANVHSASSPLFVLGGFGCLKDYICVAWVGSKKTTSRDVRVCVVWFSDLIGVHCCMWKRPGACYVVVICFSCCCPTSTKRWNGRPTTQDGCGGKDGAFGRLDGFVVLHQNTFASILSPGSPLGTPSCRLRSGHKKTQDASMAT